MAKLKHMSRLAAPNTWPIKRKGTKWIAKPTPGANILELSMPLSVCLRELLEVTENRSEVKRLLNAKEVLVNGRNLKDERFSVGIFDVIAFPKSGKNFRLVMNSIGKLNFIEITKEEAKLIVAKVVSKTTLKKAKQQLNMSNGWNILSNEKYNVGDVLFVDVNTRKPIKHIAFANGKLAYVVGGKHPGVFAKIKDTKEIGELKKRKIAIMKNEGETWETDANQLFVIGDKEAEIKLQ